MNDIRFGMASLVATQNLGSYIARMYVVRGARSQGDILAAVSTLPTGREIVMGFSKRNRLGSLLLWLLLLGSSVVRAQTPSLSDLDALRYIASHGDLIEAFGADPAKGRSHYEQWGIKEGRKITFEPSRYMASHPDLIMAFTGSEEKATRHYIEWGYREGRSTTAFDGLAYIASYADLIAAFNTDSVKATRHYIEWGFQEGRRITFDPLAYIASYADLIAAFATDAIAGAKHYIQWGFKEGRSIIFDVGGYLAQNLDVQNAFDGDLIAAVKHYINWGFREGRSFLVTVSAAAGEGGTVSSKGGLVQLGQTSVFTFTPQRGYILKSVMGCAGRLSGATFTTTPATGPCTVIGQFEKSDKPVAVTEPKIYAVNRYITLDASKSYDPNDKPITCQWTVDSAPVGFVGIPTGSCRSSFNFLDSNGQPLYGSMKVMLRVSNGTLVSDPISVDIEICCSGFAAVADASDFVRRLPSYSLAEAQRLYREYIPLNDKDYFVFASLYGLSPYHLDHLRGLSPGATMRRISNVDGSQFDGSPPNGGSTIVGFSMEIPEVIQTDLDFAKVVYPRDYAPGAAKTATVKDPFCSYASDRNTFRLADLGEYPLPEIKAVSLPGDTIKLAFIKDIWSLLTPNLAQGCVFDMAIAVDTMFDRLNQLNVSAVSVTPWSWFDARQSKWRVIPAGDKSSDIYASEWTDENLKWFVERAKKRGFKVYWVNQIQAASTTRQEILSAGDTKDTDVRKAFDALDVFLLERGRYLQSIGVDGIFLGSWYWVNFESYLPVTEFSSRTTQMIGKLRENFRGKIAYSVAGPDAITSELTARVDYFVYPLGVRYSAEELKNYSVANVKEKLATEYARYAEKLNGKPIFWQPHIQSRRDFFPNQEHFDPFCTPRGDVKCPQEAMRGDYSLQAVFSEAALEFIASKPSAMTGGVTMEYHMNANNLPPSNFFNIDASVRGKPSEYIFYKWFTAK